MKLLIISFLFSIALCQNVNSQTDSSRLENEVAEICHEMEQYSRIEGSSLSSNAFPSEQWRKFQKLLSLSTDSMLFALTDHHSPVMRGYAYFGLMNRNTVLLVNAIKNHPADTAAVFYQDGCIGQRTNVIDLAVEQTYFKFVFDDKKGLNNADAEYITQLHRAILSRRIEAYRAAKKRISEDKVVPKANGSDQSN